MSPEVVVVVVVAVVAVAATVVVLALAEEAWKDVNIHGLLLLRCRLDRRRVILLLLLSFWKPWFPPLEHSAPAEDGGGSSNLLLSTNKTPPILTDFDANIVSFSFLLPWFAMISHCSYRRPLPSRHGRVVVVGEREKGVVVVRGMWLGLAVCGVFASFSNVHWRTNHHALCTK